MSAARKLRPGLVIALSAALVLLCCGGGFASFLFDASKNAPISTFGCGDGKLVNPDARLPRHQSLGQEQVRNAAVIIRVGQDMQIPPRGWIIAVATAMQESRLRNLPHLGKRNDHDSVGLFQQRPSMGWGSVQQIMDPEYSSKKFYEGLLEVSDWETLPLTVAAQRVQNSTYPNAYAKHEQFASTVVNTLTGGAARAVGNLTQLRCAAAGEVSASGWTAPVKGTVGSGFRTATRPNHQGVDIMAPRDTVIRSAADGYVLRVRCNAIAPNGSEWGCYRDGNPFVRGCGWYVDIQHAKGVITRYCHMIRAPSVQPGQHVAAGQEIGFVGSTGRSSGPHLHFETHTNNDSSNNGAVDPVRFMLDMGAPLGAEPQ